MDVKKLILDEINRKSSVTAQEIVEQTGLSRQAVNKHVKQLVLAEKIAKEGVTRGVRYIPFSDKTDHTIHVNRALASAGCNEDEVWNRISLQKNLPAVLKSNVLDILEYAFTEILNNAIDHARSEKIRILVDEDSYSVSFKIKDAGIGIFENIRKSFGLPDEYAALQELLKGKASTAPEKHAGEGIYFTTKSVDKTTIASHKISLCIDTIARDTIVREVPFLKGTSVVMHISLNSKRQLSRIFDRYAGEQFDYSFSKTTVRVNLFYTDKTQYVSRSEARRLLHRLDRFREIILNFDKVKSIGQGFADEIFRVFQNKNPEITIVAENTCEVVRAMINHVKTEAGLTNNNLSS